MANLATAYKALNAEVLRFFAQSPSQPLEVPPKPGPWAEGLAEALLEYNARLGAPKAFRGDEAVVVAGQQPGLFTGPLYTILKAVTAIQLAQALERKHGVPCVPIFWIGSEDHDFEETRTVHFLSKDHRDETLTYTPVSKVDGLPMYHVPAEPSLHALVDRLATETAGSEWRNEIQAFLHESLDAADSFADWTARILARLFRETPLVLFSPHLPQARRAAALVMRREIDAPLESTGRLNAAGADLAQLGYAPQVVKGAEECNFFVEVQGHRRKVHWEKDRFYLPEEKQHYHSEEMRALLESAPERFSPNVALRPVVQQALFPAAAYVAGPGEIAYWAQLRSLFAFFEQPMPLVYPRADAVFTTLKLNKIRRKLGVDIAQLSSPMEQLEADALRSVQQHPALGILEQHRAVLLEQLAVMKDELEATTRKPEPWQAMLPNLNEQLQQMLDRLERAVLHNDQAQVEATRRQLERICTSLAPSRKPQDRVYTIFSWIFEHGWGLIPRLIEDLTLDYGQRQEVEL